MQQALAKQSDEIIALLSLSDTKEQSQRIAPNTKLGYLLDQALDEVMALANLVQLFGKEATANPLEEFFCHFANRIRHAFATFPAAENPYLWQMLSGRYPGSIFCPWLSLPSPIVLPDIIFRQQLMTDALERQTRHFDFIQMSNILDWLPEAQAVALLNVAQQALKPGGWVLIRQLNSSLNIAQLGSMFDWHTEEARVLHLRDRSFFYRALHLGRKR